jgi:hypothetical protein
MAGRFKASDRGLERETGVSLQASRFGSRVVKAFRQSLLVRAHAVSKVELDRRDVERLRPARPVAQTIGQRALGVLLTKEEVRSTPRRRVRPGPRTQGRSLFPSEEPVYCLLWPSPQRHPTMTSRGTAHARFTRAIRNRTS